MKSLRTFAAIGALLLLAQAATAQQPASSKKRNPRLTTDDVMRPNTDQATEAAQSKPESAGPKSAEGKTDPEEAAWRERVGAARQQAKAAQRAAEEGELRVTELRNALGKSGQTPAYRNQVAAELEQSGQRLNELRLQARAAAEALTSLIEYGRQRGFTEAAEPKAESKDGRPNEDYYRTKFANLNEAIQTAERRIQLYENRIRELSERLNNPSVDRFTVAQLQQERDAAHDGLKEAQAARAKARTDLDALVEEARRAGVSPGTFR